MSDVARVQDERGFHGHPVHQLDGLLEGARHIGIGFLVEANMRVADLHEQRGVERCRFAALGCRECQIERGEHSPGEAEKGACAAKREALQQDRKSTRLNSSHSQISYAVFCLKKKRESTPSSVQQTSL